MTNLEKFNQLCGGNESAEEMALEMLLDDIQKDYNIEISDAYKYVIVSGFFAKKAWLESEVEGGTGDNATWNQNDGWRKGETKGERLFC